MTDPSCQTSLLFAGLFAALALGFLGQLAARLLAFDLLRLRNVLPSRRRRGRSRKRLVQRQAADGGIREAAEIQERAVLADARDRRVGVGAGVLQVRDDLARGVE